MKRILLFLLISLCAVTMVFAQGGTESQSEKKDKSSILEWLHWL